MLDEDINEALEAEEEYRTAVEDAYDYIENFDILETITNVGNDEVFTPRKTADMMLDSLPEEVWHNPDYKWLNPATKNGIFEREIAIRLDKGLERIIPDMEKRRKHILQNMIYSFGQTKFTANVARRTVYYCSQANRMCDGLKASDGHYINGYSIGNGTWFSDEDGNIKTPILDHYFVDSKGHEMPVDCDEDTKKEYKCIFCGISGASDYNDKNQREKYAYEFIHIPREELNQYIYNRFFGGKKMKFDIIIGNPPYQLKTTSDSSQSVPIYHKFVEQALALDPKYLCMIIPSRWFAGGMGLDDFRSVMLSNRKIKKLVDWTNAKDCFPMLSIGGGVCYFLYDKTFTGEPSIVNIHNNQEKILTRSLNEFGDVFVRYNEAIEILRKVKAFKEKTFEEYVTSLSPFGVDSKERGHKEFRKGDLSLYSSEGVSYIEKSAITTGFEFIDKFKIMVSKVTAEHAGEPDRNGRFKVLSTTKMINPNDVCTFSYFLVGVSDKKHETENILSYMKTKFFRFLLLLSVSSINLSKDKFRFIPLQDFTQSWSDAELYKKYNLSTEDISYIEGMIKEMY